MKGIIRNLLREALLDEVSDDVYDLVKGEHSGSRIIMSKFEDISYRSTPDQPIGVKPRGLWYGIGPSWINWVRSEMPDWERDNVFVLDIDESKMKIIRTYDELIKFDEAYGVNDNRRYGRYREIDWSRVANDWGGIEIAPYIYEARYDVFWHYGWDVASGCIWGDGVIKNIRRIN
jgi:hypothetical protein